MWKPLAALLVAAGVAHAGPKPRERIDMTDAIGKVEVLRDEAGKYYVIPKEYGDAGDNVHKWTFFGDGRTMYLQRIPTSSNDQEGLTIGVWSPRVRGLQYARIERLRADGRTSVICRMQGEKFDRRPLVAVPEAEATKLLKTARFEGALWDRRVFFFGRAAGTTYYLVDILREGGQGFRMFVGRKGQMKQVPITDFANDTAGASVMTKAGLLAIAPRGGDATWRQGKKTVAITRLDPDPNAYLIYRDLGVYGQLGTVCEDQ